LPALLLTACGSGSQASPQLTSLGSSTGSPAATPGDSNSGAGSGSPGPSARPAAFPRCYSSDLTPNVDVDDSNDHHLRWTLTLTNVSDHTCQTRGWVGLDVIIVKGYTATVQALKIKGTGNAVNVVIQPGGSAYSILTRPSTDDGRCGQNQPTLLVAPPGGEPPEKSADFSGGPVCDGHIIATALAAGIGTSS
jgi:Domain of unknown function (DUF4232)